MNKRRKPHFSVCKNIKGKQKNIWGVIKAAKFRSIKILKQKAILLNRELRKLSYFGKFLQKKQILQNYYANSTAKNFNRFLKLSKKSSSKTLNKLLSLLESRADVILYRAGFTSSLKMSRQMLSHRLVIKNDKTICSNNVIVNPGDILEYRAFFLPNLIKIIKQRQFRIHRKVAKKGNSSKKFMLSLVRVLNEKSRLITTNLKKVLRKAKKQIKCKSVGSFPICCSCVESNIKIFKLVYLTDKIRLENIYHPLKTKHKKYKSTILETHNDILYC